ncbi:MAG: carbon-nitrogen hydrolase family protein [Gemmatimonadales bacterium]
MRLALANLPAPSTPDESVLLAEEAIAAAGRLGALIVAFPECFVPGYRSPGRPFPPPDPAFLERAWTVLGVAAGRARVGVILGTERVVSGALRATVLVLDTDGTRLGFQDKVQLDPTEDATYSPGTERRVFTVAGVPIGVSICHEGWRYPETVRWAVREGARIVFHPHFHEPEPGGVRPTSFADPANTFHEKALLCRAAENTCFVASVNCAAAGSPTTSVVVAPDGTVVAWQPYGEAGLLVADVDPAAATGLLAQRLRPA